MMPWTRRPGSTGCCIGRKSRGIWGRATSRAKSRTKRRPKVKTAVTALLAGTDQDIEAAAQLLAAGELVAFGTETVYGLGADATNAKAVAAIFAAKGRPHFNPLICHYASADAAFADVAANDV